jgi:hypothetical protein
LGIQAVKQDIPISIKTLFTEKNYFSRNEVNRTYTNMPGNFFYG